MAVQSCLVQVQVKGEDRVMGKQEWRGKGIGKLRESKLPGVKSTIEI